MERQAAVLALWGGAGAIGIQLVVSAGILGRNGVGDEFLLAVSALAVAVAGAPLSIAFHLALWTLAYCCAVPPIARLRESVLITIACLSAAGLAVVAVLLLSVFTNWDEERAGLALPIMAGVVPWLLLMALACHQVHLGRLAAHFGDKRLASNLIASFAILAAGVPAGGLAVFLLARGTTAHLPNAGDVPGFLALAGVGLFLIGRYATLVKQLLAIVPRGRRSASDLSPKLAALSRQESSP
jgi:hypothetical protein